VMVTARLLRLVYVGGWADGMRAEISPCGSMSSGIFCLRWREMLLQGEMRVSSMHDELNVAI
jgi:hypothetical protein